MSYRNVRSDGIVGVYANKDSMNSVDLHFAEWWSGEGADFTFNEGKKSVSLSLEEMKAIAIAAGLMNMFDFDDVIQEISEIRAESLKRQREIEEIAASIR